MFVTKIAKAIEKDSSLFAAGIISCGVYLERDACINYRDKETGEEKVGKAIVNYSCADMDLYKGKRRKSSLNWLGIQEQAICQKITSVVGSGEKNRPTCI